MTTQFNSNVTYFVDTRTQEQIKADALRREKESIRDVSKKINEYSEALDFTYFKDKYDFWKEWYWWSGYDENGVDIELPKLLDNWEYEIEKVLQAEIKNFVK